MQADLVGRRAHASAGTMCSHAQSRMCVVTPEAWSMFVHGIKNREFDLT